MRDGDYSYDYEKFKLLKEEYFTNTPKDTESILKFQKKLFQFAKGTNIISIPDIFKKLNTDNARVMDLEFLKMYLSRLSEDLNKKPIAAFENYWLNSLGILLKDGFPQDFNLIINDDAVFTSLLINNSMEEILLLLEITLNRLEVYI